MGGKDITYNAPTPMNYGESMLEALQAQVEMAPALFRAESDVAYGRPAYARLEQQIAQNSLLGETQQYDSQGRIVDGYSQSNAGNYKVVTENRAQTGIRNLRKPPQVRANLIDTSTGNVVLSGDFGSDKNQAFASLFNKPEASDLGLTKQDLTRIQKSSNPNLLNFSVGATRTPDYRRDASGNIIYERDKAGQTVRKQDGLVDLLGGTQDATFYNEDGSTVQRQAGFDQDDNFLGVAQFEQDLRQREIRNRVSNELGLVSDFGDRATQLYRQQGRIGQNLARANAYGDMSSQPLNQDTDIFSVLGGSTGNANSARNLSQTMVAQAQEGLDAGGDLTDRERRNAIQDARQASTARGRGRDFSAVVDELENVANARRQREMDRRNYAGQVMNTQTGLMDRAMSQRQIVEGQRQQGLQMDRGYATQLVGLEQATAVDPFQAIINKPSGVTNQAGQAVYGNAYQGVGASPALYNPAQGVQFMADQQAQLNSYNSAFAGAQAQQSAGKSAMLGNIIGGVAGVGTSYFLNR